MGNSMRFKHKLAEDPHCCICGAEKESTLHILQDGPTAPMVWRTLVGPTVKPEFYQWPLKKWFTANLQYHDEKGYPIWPTLFCISIWWIWRWRNCIVLVGIKRFHKMLEPSSM